MLIIQSNGRLGNQLFQLAFALTERGEREWLVLYDFNEALSACAVSSRSILRIPRTSKWMHRLFNRVLLPMGRLLGRSRVFGRIEPDYHLEADRRVDTGGIRKQGGILPVTFVDLGYYQNAERSAAAVKQLHINGASIEQARVWLSAVVEPRLVPVFVHIRRGDYLEYKIFHNQAAVLPNEYYRAAMARITRTIPNAFFCILSDDVAYARDFAVNCPRSCVSENSQEIDLAIMSLCHTGVLSASSFAWWSSMFSHPREQLPIAPHYWLGWAAERWYPKGLESSSLDWLNFNLIDDAS